MFTAPDLPEPEDPDETVKSPVAELPDDADDTDTDPVDETPEDPDLTETLPAAPPELATSTDPPSPLNT